MSVEPGTLILLAGAAGSGKSTLAARRWPPDAVYARDWARRAVGAQPADVSPPVLRDADNLLLLIAAARLYRDQTTVIDSTGTAERLLDRMLELGRVHGARCELLIVSAPLPLCRIRNAARPLAERVPEDVLAWQHAAVEAMVGRYAAGPAPWDDVQVVLASAPAGAR